MEKPVSSTRPGNAEYVIVTAVLGAVVALLVFVTGTTSRAGVRPYSLLGPILTLVGLTAVVWVLMTLARNVSVFLGAASVNFYKDYASSPPPEWIERPARTFNNLMEVPTLFYALCAFIMATGAVDSAQITLAWIFAATRVVHALIYIAVNRVSYRFVIHAAGCITLGVMWFRFAEQTWPAW